MITVQLTKEEIKIIQTALIDKYEYRDKKSKDYQLSSSAYERLDYALRRN